jgi:putative ABC transport system permease protein
MKDALREVVEAVTRHRLRALATAFGVFWGIFMLTLLLAGGNGLRNGILGIFAGFRNMAWIESGRTSTSFQGIGAGRHIMFDIHDVAAIESAIPELSSVTPRQALPPHLTVRHGNVNLSLPLVGIYDDFAKIVKMKAVRGRLLNRIDMERSRRVVVIGERARKLLFNDEDPIGQTLLVGSARMTVVGEYKDPGDEEDNRRVYMPYSTLRQTFDSNPRVHSIVANSREGANEDAIRKRFMHVMARRHRFDPNDVSAIDMWFAAAELKRVQKLIRGIDLAIVVVGLGTLLSGMVGVSNILFVSVRERAKEFGIRRALGATARSILGMVMTEALLLSTLAGGLGLLCALGLVELAQRLGLESDHFKHPEVDLSAALWALGMLVVTALIAGFFPAREAARMTPIDALRRE